VFKSRLSGLRNEKRLMNGTVQEAHHIEECLTVEIQNFYMKQCSRITWEFTFGNSIEDCRRVAIQDLHGRIIKSHNLFLS
jgi:hypothetical protein